MKKLAGKILEKNLSWDSTIDKLLGSISKKTVIRLNKNEFLYRQNKPIDGVYYLLTGKIKIIQKDNDEKYNLLHSVKAPDIIGLSSILCDEFHPNSAYSVEKSNILLIPKKDFLAVLNENSQIAMDLMKFLCQKIDKIESRIPQIC